MVIQKSKTAEQLMFDVSIWIPEFLSHILRKPWEITRFRKELLRTQNTFQHGVPAPAEFQGNSDSHASEINFRLSLKC